MFDQLFSRRNSEVEHASPTRESGTPVSPHMPISQCIAGEVAGIGVSIGYCDSPPPPIISVESIVAAKPWYEDFRDYSLISVGSRDGNEEEHSSAGHTRGWNASGFLAAICGIGIALSFWTPKNLWVIMGGFGLRREKRQHKSREQVRVQAREGVYAHERIRTKSVGKGKQRAIEASESEGESSTTLGESTPLLAGPNAPSYNRVGVYDSDGELEPTFTRGDLEPAPVSPTGDLLTTIEEDIEPRSLPRNSGFQLPERKLQTEQPILEGPEAAEVATPDSEGQCPFHVRKNSLQIQPLPASIVIPTEKPASIRRPRSQESITGSPPKDSPASSYRSRSLPRAFAMRDSAKRREEEVVEVEVEEKKVEEPQAMESEVVKAIPEHVRAEEPDKEKGEKEDREVTPVFNLIPATPATIPQEVRDAAEASMKETRDGETSAEDDRKDYRKTLSDSASIRSKKHSRANSLSDLKEEPEPATPAGGNSGSLTVDYKGKQPATSDEDDISIVDHPVSASPDQLSINEETKKTEEPKPAPVTDSPSHGPPPSRGGSFMDDGKSISSQDPKSSPSRKGSFRRMVSAGLPTRQPSSDAMKKESSLRRSLTSVMPGGKSKKRDKSAPPSSASSQILKLGEPTPPPTPPETRTSRDEAEAIRPSSRRSERSIRRSMSWNNAISKLSSGDKKRNMVAKQASDTEASAGSKSNTEAVKPSNGSINTASPVKPDETPAVSPVASPSSDSAQNTREEEKPKPASRRSSWWGMSKELARKNSTAKSDKGEEVVTRPNTATSTAAPAVAPATPERRGKEVERPAEVTTDASPAPAPAVVPAEGVAKSDTPVTANVEPATTETAAAEAPAAAAPSPPKPMLRGRVKSIMAWRSKS